MSTSTRIIELIRIFNFFEQKDVRKASDYLTQTVNLLFILTSRALVTVDQQFKLKQYKHLVSVTATLMLESNQSSFEVVNVLKIDRDVMSSMYLETRSDITLLKDSHLDLELQFEQLRRQLDLSDSNLDTHSTYNESTKSSRDRISQYKIVKRYKAMLREIRMLLDFKRFLLRSSENELSSLVSQDSIVFLNTSLFRCDAIIVSKERTLFIRLLKLQFEQIEENSKIFIDEDTLEQTLEFNETYHFILK